MEPRQFIKQNLVPIYGVEHPGCLIHMENHLTQVYLINTLKIEDFSRAVHMSESTLRRKCLKFFGIPPSELLLRYRVEMAKELLAAGQQVGDVSAEVGFATHAHFSTQFKRLAGMTPQQFAIKNLKS